MTFRGLFIGVDRYASQQISDLTCSARDAQALYALFADTLGGADSTLLINAEATRTAIVSALTALSTAAPDDLVFIHFSGHGSDTHHLITHDADPLALDATAIHLQELVDLFAGIPSRNVVLCLDCCFAGGAGAKVFRAPVASRDPASTEGLLDRIGGSGRVIFTAAGPDQEAIEDRRRGHGVFSYFLIEALRGAPEVMDAGALPFLSLMHFVTAKVEAAASLFRHHQQPAVRGVLDGEVRLPILTPAAVYKSFFPDAATSVVGADLADLLVHGFPQEAIDAIGSAIPSLNSLQQTAINEMGLLKGENVVVSAPTSSGKTMIGEIAALKTAMRGERSYMLLPLRALVNDKHLDLQQKYASLGVRVIRSTGEIADDNDALMRGKFDIALLTYERFTTLAVTSPSVLRNVGLVIVDEVQMITDAGRGANLEFLLTLLRAQKAIGIEPQLVALSAVIGNTNGFDRWLDARLLVSTERPVPLEEGTLNLAGDYHFMDTVGAEQRAAKYVVPEYRKGSSQDVIIPLVRQLVANGEKVIVFRDTKPVVRATAAYLAESLGLKSANQVLAALPSSDPSAASGTLRKCLEGGVAFHNTDLERGEREAVEASFREPSGEIKVLVATTTLAMGVNTPAWSVVIEGLEHPGDQPYTVAEYKNMVGRAGRLGWSPKGKAFLVAARAGEENRLWRQYVLGRPEDLKSRFGEQKLLSAVCRVLATAGASKAPGMDPMTVAEFLQSSFAAHQSGRTWSHGEVQAAIEQLERAGMAESFDGRYRLTALGAVAGELGIEVESVARVARALRGVSTSAMRAETVIAATLVTEELDDVFMLVHKKSVKERQRWQGVPAQQQLPHQLQQELRNVPDADYTARCKKLASTLMWVQGVDLEAIERSVLIHLPSENAAGPIRGVAERTRDLIGVVARVSTILNAATEAETNALGGVIDELATQLELGVPRQMVWLGRTLARRISRGDYLALYRAGLLTPDAIMEPGEKLKAILPSGASRLLVLEAAREHTEPSAVADLPMPAPPSV